jgi:hypothetical protein
MMGPILNQGCHVRWWFRKWKILLGLSANAPSSLGRTVLHHVTFKESSKDDGQSLSSCIVISMFIDDVLFLQKR